MMLLCISSGKATAQESTKKEEKLRADFFVDFRWDNSVLKEDYLGTAAQLQALADSIAAIESLDPKYRRSIDSIYVTSYSSPEGRMSYNRRLSERRAAAMLRYLNEHYPQYSDITTVTPDGESWHMFRAKVLADSTLTDNQRIRLLGIIDSDATADQKKQMIKDWDIALYRRITREYFVTMRRSFITLEWTESLVLTTGEPLERAFIQAPPLAVPPTGDSRASWSLTTPKTLFTLKTNLLYDAVTALNFEVEVPIGEHFSIAVSDLFPWWTWGPNGKKYAFQIWEMGIEPRYWFNASSRGGDSTRRRDGRMSGWFIGPYLSSAKYDLQRDYDITTQGEYWTAGVSGGYVLPLGDLCRLELSASVGYLQSDYRRYQPSPDYEHLYRDPYQTGTYHFFGPTRLKASLVLPITVRKTRTSGPMKLSAR